VAKINPLQAITSLRQIWNTVRLYFPPDFTTDRGNLISGTLQSASVAMMATSIGFLLAVPIGLLAARNVSDKWVYRWTRGFLVVVRGLYMLDVNFRSSTILGLVGGGGIGFILFQSVQILAYRTTGAVIILTFSVVLVIEIITNWVRKYLI
jgi:ABC-type phosphate/phosphonate transport system permease subunit